MAKITDAELDELEFLLEQQERFDELKNPTDKSNKNFRYLQNAVNEQEWGFDDNGRPVLIKGFAGVGLEGSSRCFNPDQKVVTINGSKEISKLSKGDKVKSYNETTGKNEFQPVLKVHKFDNKKPSIRIRLKNGETIECTEDHEFYYKGAWVNIKHVVSLWNDKEKNKHRRE